MYERPRLGEVRARVQGRSARRGWRSLGAALLRSAETPGMRSRGSRAFEGDAAFSRTRGRAGVGSRRVRGKTGAEFTMRKKDYV